MAAVQTPFDCETGEQQVNRSKTFKTYKAMGSVFVLGMIIGMAGLVAVEHYGLADSNITSLFFASPVAPKVGATKGQSTNTAPISAVSPNTGQNRATAFEMMGDSENEFAPTKAMSPCSRRKALQAAAGMAVAGIGAPALAASTASVKMGSDSGGLVYDPADVTICAGDTVEWVMNKAGPHAVVFDEDTVPEGVDAAAISMEEGVLLGDPGEIFKMKFDKPGKYGYICPPHGSVGMKGNVIVKA
jgi:plastocyanin